MGKRWQNIIVLTLILSSLVSKSLIKDTYFSQSLSKLDRNLTAKAQEINPDPDKVLDLAAKSGFVGDSIVEQPVILKATEKSKKVIRVWVTAYTDDPSETKDYAIGITAMGTITRDGVAAANFLPFGTKFMIPEIYGSKIFTVEDRMNPRYNNQKIIDIWMMDKKSAIEFGKKMVTIELL